MGGWLEGGTRSGHRARGRVGAMCAVLVLLASLLVTVAPSPAGAAPPPNDDWTAATSLGSVPASTSGTSVDATAELDEPAHGSGGPFSSVWWSFTPASDDIFTVDTCGSAFDTVLAVYVGPSLDSLTQIGASDDDCGLQSSVTFDGTAGSPYWIAVDGVSGATGAIDLALDLGTPTGLRGTVTDRGSTPLSGVTVTATAAGEPPATTTTDVSGEYQFVDLAPGDWTVHFDPAAPHVAEYHDDAHSPDLATPVPVSAAGMSTGVDASLGSTCTSVQDAGCFLVSDVACFVGVPLAAQHTWQLYWEDGRCGDASAVDWSSTEGHAEVGQGSVVQLPSGTSLTLTGCAALGGSTYCDSATFEVGEDTHGLLRVKTSPPLPSQVVVDGVPRNDWGLDWVTVPVGHHQVCFTDVAGYGTPPCELVAVAEGATTALDGVFTELGLLKVEVDPAGLAVDVLVDGLPANQYGSFAWRTPGTHEVCWEDAAGYTTPACQAPSVTAGTQTTVTGTFTSTGP